MPCRPPPPLRIQGGCVRACKAGMDIGRLAEQRADNGIIAGGRQVATKRCRVKSRVVFPPFSQRSDDRLPQFFQFAVGKGQHAQRFAQLVEQVGVVDDDRQQNALPRGGEIARIAAAVARRRRGAQARQARRVAARLLAETPALPSSLPLSSRNPGAAVAALARRRGEGLVHAAAHLRAVEDLHVAVGDLAHPRLQRGLHRRLRFGGIGGLALRLHAPDRLGQRDGGAQHLLHGAGALLADQAVGVLPLRQKGDAGGMAGGEVRQDALHRPPRRPAPGLVAVEAEKGHLLRVGNQLPQLLHLCFGQGGAERRHRALEAGADQRDDVHVAFGDDHRLAVRRRLPRPRQAVEQRALVKQRGVGGVDVFRAVALQDAPAEGDHPAPPVGHREDHPVAEEAVGRAPVLRPLQQAGGHHVLFREALLQQLAAQRAGIAGGEAQAEARHAVGVQPAALEILQSGPARGGVELLLEPACGLLHQIVQRLAPLVALLVLFRGAGNRHPRLAGQRLHRLREGEVVVAHHEADDVAVRPTSEAMEEALLVVDVEGGRLLIVEGARGLVLAPGADQAQALAHHVRQGQTSAQLLQELGREGHGRRPCSVGISGPKAAASRRCSPWRSPSGRRSGPSAPPSPCPCP